MKRLKTMTCPKMIKWMVLEIGGVLMLPVMAFLLMLGFDFDRWSLIVGIVWCIMAGVAVFFQYPMWKRVFLPVTLDGQGIKNRYCTLRWQEIERLDISETTYRTPFRGVPGGVSIGNMGLMICLYRNSDAKAQEFYACASFFELMLGNDGQKREHYPLNDRIFLPYTEKTVAMIRAHAPQLLQKEER
ncbi:MAG: hypothetical protein J6M12_01105 [Clostridia bacterium]|nr:hypothetical protein [Clostridia bacterium]